MTTDPELALRFCRELFEELREHISDPVLVRDRVADIPSGAFHKETAFCKGCILPVFDSCATRFMSEEFGLERSHVRRALRCEGFSNIHKIYQPTELQSGFSGYTWGTNFQNVSKQGKIAPMGSRGFQPCPDFGLVHCDRTAKFSLVGETKFKQDSPRINVRDVENDLRYYVGLPSEPEKGWDYDFGFGIAYAAGGAGLRQAHLSTEHWQTNRYVIATFQA